jgi:hypothetical protein
MADARASGTDRHGVKDAVHGRHYLRSPLGTAASPALGTNWEPVQGSLDRSWRTALMKNPLTYRAAKRIVIAIIGGTVTLIGVALIILPGPAFIVIPLGLSILATEFLWAKRWLHKIRQMASNLTSRKP